MHGNVFLILGLRAVSPICGTKQPSLRGSYQSGCSHFSGTGASTLKLFLFGFAGDFPTEIPDNGLLCCGHIEEKSAGNTVDFIGNPDTRGRPGQPVRL